MTSDTSGSAEGGMREKYRRKLSKFWDEISERLLLVSKNVLVYKKIKLHQTSFRQVTLFEVNFACRNTMYMSLF
jgi:hypothetical protein